MRVVIGLLALAFAGFAPTTASAQCGGLVCPFWEKPAPHRASTPSAPSFSNITCRDNGGKLPTFTHRTGKVVVIFLCDQHLIAYVKNTMWAEGVISTGKIGYETPPGLYVVCGPPGNANSRSSKYPLPNGGAPMPWAVSFCKAGNPPVWTGMAIHAGELSGSRLKPFGASHGCVRTETMVAREINTFSDPKYGPTEVIVVRDVQEFYDLYDYETAVTN